MENEEFELQLRDYWARFIDIQGYTKLIAIFSEEVDKANFRAFVQPFKEIRDALDHIVRAQKRRHQKDILDGNDQRYILGQFSKALGHQYRAFFDYCDWISQNIRMQISLLLQPYAREAIVTAIPNYYSEILPGIDTIADGILKIRSGKDIESPADLANQVACYHELIKDLERYRRTISTSIGSLEDIHSRDNREKSEEESKEEKVRSSERLWRFVMILVGGVLGWIIRSVS